MGKPFIKVRLNSGIGGEPLGGKDLVIYYECDKDAGSVYDIIRDKATNKLLDWVNTCGRFPKGSKNQNYEFYEHDTFELVLLDEDQVKCIRKAGCVFRKNGTE